MFDDIDMKHSFRVGFWIGATAGAFGMFLIGVAVGILQR